MASGEGSVNRSQANLETTQHAKGFELAFQAALDDLFDANRDLSSPQNVSVSFDATVSKINPGVVDEYKAYLHTV